MGEKQKKVQATTHREREVAYIRTKLKFQIRVASGESASFGKMEQSVCKRNRERAEK